EKANGPAALDGQGSAATSRLRKPAATAAPQRETSPAPARRADRTKFRSLLRHGRHAPYASAQALEHSEAAVDSRRSVQSKLDFGKINWGPNPGGGEKPPPPGFYFVF